MEGRLEKVDSLTDPPRPAEDIRDMTDEEANLPPPEPQVNGLLLTDLSRGMIGWESVEDPQNPQNWTGLKKAHIMIYMALLSTLSPMASSLVAPGITDTLQELNETSRILGTFQLTVFVLGYAAGVLFLGPLSELYGRYPATVWSIWGFVAGLIGCGFSPNISALIVLRFLAGVGGSGVMTIAPAVVADLYPLEKRAFWTAAIIMAQCVGPVLGPICGGFIVQALGWRWMYWVLIISTGAAAVPMTLLMPESYAPRILQVKARKLCKEIGREDLRPYLASTLTGKAKLMNSLVRPVKLLTRSMATLFVCIYLATIYAIMYLFFTTIPTTFESVYGWSTSITGLASAPLGIGMLICLVIIMKTNDAAVLKLTKENGGKFEPEFRLPTTVYYAVMIPIALLWYGWAIQRRVHWVAPLFALNFFGWGMLGIYMTCQTYLVDAFTLYAASAVAACRMGTSIVGAFLPMAGPPLYAALDMGVGNTVLAVISLVMIPIPVILNRYGKAIRTRYPVTL